MERKIAHIESCIQEKKDMIEYNCNEINKGNNIIFYNNWNRDLEIEIEAFRIALNNYNTKQITV